MEPSTQQTSPAIPIAIIVGFTMIALAIFFTGDNTEKQVNIVTDQSSGEAPVNDGTVRPVGETDYIRGNPNAPILMIEYSDYDCPFCKQFHTTMNQVMDEYGVTGQLAWVYRQFPLTQLHPNSPLISEAALCVGDIGGNEAFWTFSDLIFHNRDLDAPTNVTKLLSYAETAGISSSDYTKCVDSERMEAALTADITDALNSGAKGTPYTVLIVGDQQAIINGAQPYSVVKGIVANLIDQLEGNFNTETVESSEIPLNDNGIPLLE